MKAESARKYRAYPNETQTATLTGWCHTARAVWNVALAQRQMVWETWRRTLRAYDQARYLTEWRAEVDWARDFPAQAAQHALKHLDRAYDNWWSNPQHFGPPQFKKHGTRMSFGLPGQAVRVRRLNARWAEIRLPKVGWVRFRLGRVSRWADLKHLRNCTVSLVASRWHVSFGVALPVKERHPSPGTVVGLDVGVAETVVLSRPVGGRRSLVRPATLSAGRARRLVGLERRKARQRKGSGGYKRTCAAIAKLHARRARTRLDWTHKASDLVASTFETVRAEALRIGNLTASAAGTVDEPGRHVAQKSGLNRSILDQQWGELFRQLGYKARAFDRVNPAGSSRTCSGCLGPVTRPCRAVVVCPACGPRHADKNAAENIETGGHLASNSGRQAKRRTARTTPPSGNRRPLGRRGCQRMLNHIGAADSVHWSTKPKPP